LKPVLNALHFGNPSGTLNV